MEPDKHLRFIAHNPFLGGVKDIFATADCRTIYSVGSDGIIRVWEWKYTNVGKRNASEASNAVRSLLAEQAPVLTEYAKSLADFLSSQVSLSVKTNPRQSLQDAPDSASQKYLPACNKLQIVQEVIQTEEKDVCHIFILYLYI